MCQANFKYFTYINPFNPPSILDASCYHYPFLTQEETKAWKG